MNEERLLTVGQPYTVGIWSIKEGMEDDFISAWITFARWTYNNTKGAMIGSLVQDTDRPNRFISFGPWEDEESIALWRGSPEFMEFIAKVKELSEHASSPMTARLVARAYP